MIELMTFGATELRRDGIDVRSVLSQPKRLALLSWLAIEAPGGFAARDRLLALFWPESDDERARNALRQALHFLRRSLGESAIVSRGDQDVGIDASLVQCDAAAFQAAIREGRNEDACYLYRGEFLPGFHVDDAPDVERWIDAKRAEFARSAAAAAWSLCEREENRGEIGAAILRARHALSIDPLAEAGVRRLMGLLAGSGERAAALEAYAELERRLALEMELEPSEETTALAAGIRQQATTPPPATGPVAAAPAPAAGVEAAPVTSATNPPGSVSPEPGPAIVATVPVTSPVSPPAYEPAVNTVPDPARAVPPRSPDVSMEGASCCPPAEPRRTARLRILVPAAVLVLMLTSGFLALRGWRTPPASASTTTPSIAVLPFLDLSDGGSNVYFSDGITEEVLNVLAQVPGLRVAARTSSFAFRDRGVPVDSIARALNVTHVLEGSVRSQGNRVRITAQLIEASTGFHMWSQTYDRDLDDIFIVQDEISAAIAQKLQIELAGNFWGLSARETDDPDAYRLLLRALHTFRTPTPENYATSATLIGEALQRDPGYARAYGALANVLLWQATFGWTPTAEAYARADSLARRGLAIAETPEAHLALARLAEVRAWNPDSADRHFRRALELNPSDARALQYRALFLARSGRGDEATAAARRATELDPLHPGSWSNYASVLSMLGREEEALTVMEKARSVAPEDVIVLTNLANQYANVGRTADALATALRALSLDSMNLNLLGLRVHLLFKAGESDEAKARLKELERRPEFPRYRLATLYGNTQNIDRILDLLEESAAAREPELSGIRSPDMFRGMRDHPRFIALLKKLESG